MKGELMPGFTCPPEESATTSTTKSTPKTCNAELERNDAAQRNPEASLDDRRVRSRLQDSKLSSDSIRKKDASRRIRPSSGGKDRHSKVNTAKGPRDRRVRLSVSTAIQFYDVQDRLGYDQPSKAVEWLLREAKAAIDKLPQLHEQLALQMYRSSTTVSGSDTRHFYAQGASIGGLEYLVGISDAGRSEDESGLAMQEIIGVGKACSSVEAPHHHAKVTATSEFSKAIDSQPGATSARIQLRTKARDRARERAKERSYGVYKEPAKASCSTTSIPSSTMHGDLPHYSKFLASHDRESIVLSPPDHHLENIVPSPSHEHVQKFHLQSLGDDKAPSSFRHAFRNYVHTEQMEAALSIQASTGRDPLSPSPAFVHDTEVHDFHQKYQKLPNLLNQASQSWPQTITTESCSPESLYCSSRKPPFSPPSYLDSGMAFRHDDSARLVSCSNAISHELAVFGVPISSFTGTIMPADRIPMTPSILSLDPSQSAFRETSQLPASHQEQALSDHLHIRRISSAHPSSFGSRPNYHILLNSPAAGVSQLASSSAFEPFSNQFPGATYSRTSSDFQHYDNALFKTRDSETLQSDLKLPARLRGLDDIEEQLKRYSHS